MGPLLIYGTLLPSNAIEFTRVLQLQSADLKRRSYAGPGFRLALIGDARLASSGLADAHLAWQSQRLWQRPDLRRGG
jgi:hypothetical protein